MLIIAYTLFCGIFFTFFVTPSYNAVRILAQVFDYFDTSAAMRRLEGANFGAAPTNMLHWKCTLKSAVLSIDNAVYIRQKIMYTIYSEGDTMGDNETVFMRVREDSRLALRLFAAQLQAQTGKRYYDADAIEEFIREHEPELLARAQAMAAEQHDENKGK